MKSFARRLLPALLLAVACRSTAPAPVPPLVAPFVEEPSLSNTLRWSTASEVDNFGFDVYRGLSEEGPFERLTTDPIPGAGTTDTPSQYSYIDSGIEVDTTYFYYVESISLQGVREQFTPIIKAAAKQPARAASAAEEGEPQQ